MSVVTIRLKQAASMPSVSKLIFLGSVAVLPLGHGTAFADWRTPLAGAPVALPSRFVPMRYIITPMNPTLMNPTLMNPTPMNPPDMTDAPETPKTAAAVDTPFRFALPLVDRHLSPAQKAEPLEAQLQEAILRIEPLFDPTRLDGPDAEPAMRVSAGTAMMDDVFADHWHAVSADPNINRKMPYIAMAWHRMRDIPCDAFTKNRTHGFGDPALDTLTAADCASLSRRQSVGLDDVLTLASARNSVPVFAAPLPGSRLSSQDFWSAQRARIAAIQAHLRRKWEPLGLRNAQAEPKR